MATGEAATAGGTESASQPGSGPSALPIEFLSQALQRLTSEVLIYLLAYAVLVASLIIWGKPVNPALRNILYILPPLGVAAYLFQQRRRIKSNRPPRVVVRALLTWGKGSVIGIRGKGYQGDVKVKAGVTANGKVVGVDVRQEVEAAAVDITYLTDLFNKLDKKGRQKVILVATELQPED